MQWSYVELKQLCEKHGIPYPNEYLTSLEWRQRRAGYHAEMAEAEWSDFMSKPFAVGDEAYQKAFFVYEAHAEACVQALHAMADILAQIINATLMATPLSEDDVSFPGVPVRLKKQGNATRIITACNSLMQSKEYRYVNAFSNTIKHRRLVRSDIGGEHGNGTRNKTEPIFAEFNYKGASYPETWGSDILASYRQEIVRLVNEVGLSVNDSLK